MLEQEALQELRQAREGYRQDRNVRYYDEALDEVASRAASNGSLSKADIGSLLFWKRLRVDTPWAAGLHSLPDAQVRAATAAARAGMAAEESLVKASSAGRSALTELPGFNKGDALASAVLTALDPERMAIYDRRSHSSLRKLGMTLSDAPGRYARYMLLLEDLRAALATSDDPWTNRDVDLALYRLAAAPHGVD